MSDLAAIRDRVELELRDTANAIWATGDIDAYLRRALGRLNVVTPRRLVGTIDAVADTYEYALTGLTGLVNVTEVWYPWLSTDESVATPVSWRPVGDGKIRVDIDAPDATYDLRVFYDVYHTIEDLDSATTTTLSGLQEEMCVVGASGFAAQSAGVESVNTVTVNGWTPRQWLEWSQVRLVMFEQMLQDAAHTSALAIDGRVAWELDWGA